MNIREILILTKVEESLLSWLDANVSAHRIIEHYKEMSMIRLVFVESEDAILFDLRWPNINHFDGYLNLSGCCLLITLPDGLRVSEDAYLSSCFNLKSLPDDLFVGGSLLLSYCKRLTHLPNGLRVGGSLYLAGCVGLTELPNRLHVSGNLYLGEGTKITERPRDLWLGGDLILGF